MLLPCLLGAVVAAAEPAPGADLPPRAPRAEGWDVYGEARLRADTLGAFPIDADGTAQPTPRWMESRLVAGASVRRSPTFKVDLEIEALNGRFAGPTTPLGTAATDHPFAVRRADRGDLPRVLPRKLALTWGARPARLLVGAQTFTWGTGMLANDGAGDPAFGDARTGSVVARLGGAFAPWSTVEGSPVQGLGGLLAADAVLRDDNASLVDGDLALAGVAGLRWVLRRAEIGALGIVRSQVDRTDTLAGVDLRPGATPAETLVWPVDVYARAELLPRGAAHRLRVEGEAVWVRGQSTRPYLESTWEDGAAVRQFGALARARWDAPWRTTLLVEGGYASGDNDPRDATARTFTMHSDHNVGIVLFEQVLPLLAARAADRVADPGLTAEVAPGLRYTIPQGGVSNAIYAFPVLRWRPARPVELRFGWVAARAAGDLIDPYHSAVAGGWPRSYGGAFSADTGRGLGHELDGGARLNLGLPGAVRAELGAEAAIFLPGDAFAGVLVDPVRAARGRLSVFW